MLFVRHCQANNVNVIFVFKVESETSYTRVGGTSMGGGTFWGLGALLTGCKTFDELIQLASSGNHKNVSFIFLVTCYVMFLYLHTKLN